MKAISHHILIGYGFLDRLIGESLYQYQDDLLFDLWDSGLVTARHECNQAMYDMAACFGQWYPGYDDDLPTL